MCCSHLRNGRHRHRSTLGRGSVAPACSLSCSSRETVIFAGSLCVLVLDKPCDGWTLGSHKGEAQLLFPNGALERVGR